MIDARERSATEAAQRLAEEGRNALPSGQRRTWRITIRETMHAPMFLPLLAAGSLYLVFGELQEGLILFGFALVTLGLTPYQEGNIGRATMQTATKKSGAGSRA